MKAASCAGQISYKWIEESIRQGQLQDPEDHRIASVKTNGGRTFKRNEFSVKDDQILMDAVLKATETGLGLSGNKLYDDIAKAVPSPISSPVSRNVGLTIAPATYVPELAKQMGQSPFQTPRNASHDCLITTSFSKNRIQQRGR